MQVYWQNILFLRYIKELNKSFIVLQHTNFPICKRIHEGEQQSGQLKELSRSSQEIFNPLLQHDCEIINPN